MGFTWYLLSGLIVLIVLIIRKKIETRNVLVPQTRTYLYSLSSVDWKLAEKIRDEVEELYGKQASKVNFWYSMAKLVDEGLIERDVRDETFVVKGVSHPRKNYYYRLTPKGVNDR